MKSTLYTCALTRIHAQAQRSQLKVAIYNLAPIKWLNEREIAPIKHGEPK